MMWVANEFKALRVGLKMPLLDGLKTERNLSYGITSNREQWNKRMWSVS